MYSECSFSVEKNSCKKSETHNFPMAVFSFSHVVFLICARVTGEHCYLSFDLHVWHHSAKSFLKFARQFSLSFRKPYLLVACSVSSLLLVASVPSKTGFKPSLILNSRSTLPEARELQKLVRFRNLSNSLKSMRKALAIRKTCFLGNSDFLLPSEKMT